MGLGGETTVRDRRLGSGLLHTIDRAVSRPLSALVVVAADVVWVGLSAMFGFPARVESVFQTLVAALTLAMVFVIQHTQSREELVTQRKLDEILHALPGADDAVIALEEASDDEVSATHQSHRQRRQNAASQKFHPVLMAVRRVDADCLTPPQIFSGARSSSLGPSGLSRGYSWSGERRELRNTLRSN